MKLSAKQKQPYRHREQTCSCQGREGRRLHGLGVRDWQMKTITYRMDKLQGPTAEHKKLYSVS